MILNDENEIIWSVEFIQKYEEIWSWRTLSSNKTLPWSIDFIKHYEEKWDWSELSSNPYLPWSIDFIKHYEEKWDWSELSSNPYLPWSIELIEKFENKWYGIALTSNNGLPFSKELIIKFEKKWFWNALSEKHGDFWSIELIKCYGEYWDWSKLSSNTSIEWSIEMIDSFYSRWNWNNLSSNSKLPWSVELITKFGRRLNLYYLNSNQYLPLSIELIKHFEDQKNLACLDSEQRNTFRFLGGDNGNFWSWSQLSRKCGGFWSIDLIKHFEDKWDWRELSSNRSLPWSNELIKQFQNKWTPNILFNYSINWSKELLQEKDNDLRNIGYRELKPLSALLELYDSNWFEIEWEFTRKLPKKINSWSLEDDDICEKFIKLNSNIENTFLQLQDWLQLYESEYLHKTAKKITKNGYNKDSFKVTFKKWEDVFWKKISASNNINFEFINKYQNELNWNILLSNSSLNWTLKEMEFFANHLQVDSNLFQTLKPHLNKTLVNSLLYNAPISDSIIIDYSEEYSIFSVIKFGKYKGKRIYEILKLNPSYINWCIINLNHFYIYGSTIRAAKIFYPHFEFSPIALKILEEKTIKLNEAQIERSYDYDNDYEKPESFEDWLDSEFGDDAGTAYWNLE